MPTNYLLHGNEKYIIDEKIQEIILDFGREKGEKPELLIIDDETSLSELQHHLTYTSLFSLAKVIVIKEPFWLQKTSRKSSQNKQVLEIFTDYFAQDFSDQILIVTTAEEAKGNPLVKLFKKNAEFIPCKSMGKAELRKWLITKLDDKGLKAKPDALKALLDSGQSMYYLDNLLEKLALEESKTVTNQRLQDELDVISDINIFRLTDALISKNAKSAITALHKLIEQGETALFFLAMINHQFTIFAKVKAAQDKGYNNVQIEQETGIRSFIVRRMLNHVSKYTWSDVWRVFELLLETDLQIKTTGFNNTILVEKLVLDICRK